jgi:hypothetical protein
LLRFLQASAAIAGAPADSSIANNGSRDETIADGDGIAQNG